MDSNSTKPQASMNTIAPGQLWQWTWDDRNVNGANGNVIVMTLKPEPVRWQLDNRWSCRTCSYAGDNHGAYGTCIGENAIWSFGEESELDRGRWKRLA